MQTTSYLLRVPTGYKRVTRRIGKRKPLKKRISIAERLVAPLLMIFTVTCSATVWLGTEQEWFSVQEVQAIESIKTGQSLEVAPAPTPEPVIEVVEAKEPTIEEYIYQVFGEDGELMYKIAQCESGLNPEVVGDTHLMGYLDGELIGDSIGLFQIRTGDAGVYDSKPWNRAKANGMTTAEFREYLKDGKNNVDYAKQIFDRQGTSAWWNCSQKVTKAL